MTPLTDELRSTSRPGEYPQNCPTATYKLTLELPEHEAHSGISVPRTRLIMDAALGIESEAQPAGTDYIRIGTWQAIPRYDKV